MNKNQIKILKLLGYKETTEKEFILKHNTYGHRNEMYSKNLDLISKDDDFEVILKKYSKWIAESAIRCSMDNTRSYCWNLYNQTDDI